MPKPQKNDPTKDPTFKRVIDHFLKSPPKPHKKPDSDEPKGKGKKEAIESHKK